jgi:hypothetical protein
VSELYQSYESSDAGADSPSYAETPSTAADTYGDIDNEQSELEGDDYAEADEDELTDEEDQLPSREEAWHETWDDDRDPYDEVDPGSEYDGDLSPLVAEEDQLPSREEARRETWGDGAEPAEAGGSESGNDEDLSPMVVEEDQLPSREDARRETWGDPETGYSSEPEHSGEAKDATSPNQEQLVVHDQEGRDVPITVVHLTPEDRTLGDDAPDGVGSKPTGEQLLQMETDDPKENRADRLFDAVFERMDDVHDATSDISHAIQEDLPRGPGQQPSSGHVGYVVHDQPTPPPDSAGNGDMVANLTVVGVMAAVGIRHMLSAHRKGRNA